MVRTVAMVFFFVAAGQLAVAVAKAAGDDPSSPLHVGTLASIDAMAPSVFDIFDSLQGEEHHGQFDAFGGNDDSSHLERRMQFVGGIQPMPLGAFLPLSYNVSNQCWLAFSRLEDMVQSEKPALLTDPCRCSNHIPYLQGCDKHTIESQRPVCVVANHQECKTAQPFDSTYTFPAVDEASEDSDFSSDRVAMNQKWRFCVEESLAQNCRKVTNYNLFIIASNERVKEICHQPCFNLIGSIMKDLILNDCFKYEGDEEQKANAMMNAGIYGMYCEKTKQGFEDYCIPKMGGHSKASSVCDILDESDGWGCCARSYENFIMNLGSTEMKEEMSKITSKCSSRLSDQPCECRRNVNSHRHKLEEVSVYQVCAAVPGFQASLPVLFLVILLTTISG